MLSATGYNVADIDTHFIDVRCAIHSACNTYMIPEGLSLLEIFSDWKHEIITTLASGTRVRIYANRLSDKVVW